MHSRAVRVLRGQGVSAMRDQSCGLVPRERRLRAAALSMRIRQFAESRPRFGFVRAHLVLRREAWPIKKHTRWP